MKVTALRRKVGGFSACGETKARKVLEVDDERLGGNIGDGGGRLRSNRERG